MLSRGSVELIVRQVDINGVVRALFRVHWFVCEVGGSCVLATAIKRAKERLVAFVEVSSRRGGVVAKRGLVFFGDEEGVNAERGHLFEAVCHALVLLMAIRLVLVSNRGVHIFYFLNF